MSPLRPAMETTVTLAVSVSAVPDTENPTGNESAEDGKRHVPQSAACIRYGWGTPHIEPPFIVENSAAPGTSTIASGLRVVVKVASSSRGIPARAALRVVEGAVDVRGHRKMTISEIDKRLPGPDTSTEILLATRRRRP